MEIERRWPIALRELSALIDRIKDISRGNPETLHKNLTDVEKQKLIEGLMNAILSDEQTELKRSVARRMADKIGTYLLWRRETTVPVIHELIVLLPWWISHLPGEVIPRLRDIGLNYILNGRVVPVQMAWQDILNADPLIWGIAPAGAPVLWMICIRTARCSTCFPKRTAAGCWIGLWIGIFCLPKHTAPFRTRTSGILRCARIWHRFGSKNPTITAWKPFLREPIRTGKSCRSMKNIPRSGSVHAQKP
ncbi:MAG: hypothetical protein R2874_03310 [Desulfobacterales bacterium]